MFGCTDPTGYNYNPLATINNGDCVMLHPGEQVHGGIVFYIDETGQHGMVAAMEDLPGTYEWGCLNESIEGADGQVIGTGYQNTLDIVQGCFDINSAAFHALNSNIEGYTGWFLPSIHELEEMYNTIGPGGPEGNIGGFDDGHYQSSSEKNNYGSWAIYFGSGNTQEYYKTNNGRVRPVRFF